MKVFIGGPLKIKTLKPDVISKLNSIIKKKYKVLIGDANGIDKTIQNYFFNKKYIIYFRIKYHERRLL